MFPKIEWLRFKARTLTILSRVSGKQQLYLVGKRRYYFFRQSGALRYDFEGKPFEPNGIVNVGKDTILKRLGNLSGGGYAAQIGVGDSADVFDAGDTDLQAATNKIWKSIVSPDGYNYIRPTLFLSVTFGYTEAIWVWNEFGLRDNNNVLMARQVDATPLTKPADKQAIAEWQLSL